MFPLFILTTGEDHVEMEGLKARLPFENLGRDSGLKRIWPASGLKLLSIASFQILMKHQDDT